MSECLSTQVDAIHKSPSFKFLKIIIKKITNILNIIIPIIGWKSSDKSWYDTKGGRGKEKKKKEPQKKNKRKVKAKKKMKRRQRNNSSRKKKRKICFAIFLHSISKAGNCQLLLTAQSISWLRNITYRLSQEKKMDFFYKISTYVFIL